MIKRHIAILIEASLKDFPAILINGPRQIGKSTLVQELVKERFVDQYFTLDDLVILEAVRADPDGFLSQSSVSVALDEIQRAPDLMRALKKNIDANRKPGRFLLTGSANILPYPGVTESLAGRMDIIPLEGFSVGELLGHKTHSTFIEDLFSGVAINELMRDWQKRLQKGASITRDQLCEWIFYGGFPEVALKKDANFKERWFSAYITAYIERDVRDLSRVLDMVAFSKLLRIAGLRTGNLLNVKNLAVDVGIDQRTAQRYLEILEITFQMQLLQPWYANATKRFVKTPKLYLNDSGFASYLAGIHSPAELINQPMIGALAETWVFAELRKLLVYSPGVNKGFYRTHAGKEVDFILNKGLQTVGIEFKLSQTVTQKDFAGLKDMQAVLGENTRGILLYTGDAVLPFGGNLVALPIKILWL